MNERRAAIPRRLLGGRTGIEVTEIGLGLWAVAGSEWGPVDDAATLEAIEVALEAGVTFFDTADVYGAGHSEELLGQAMHGRREDFIVASKIGWVGYDRQADHSAYDTVEKLVAGVESSLARLRTDYLDVIQCHVDYPEPNRQVFIDGFRRLKESGKVLAWGVSTSSLDHLRAFNAEGDCDVLQTDYSILNRTAEQEIFPYCQDQGIGVIVRGPLAMGLLSGKYSESDTFAAGDFRSAWIRDPEQNAQFLRDLQVVEALRDGLREQLADGETMAQFALRFTRTHPAVSTVIPGARQRIQSASNASAGTAPLLSADERDLVDRLVPSGGGRRIWPA